MSFDDLPKTVTLNREAFRKIAIDAFEAAVKTTVERMTELAATPEAERAMYEALAVASPGQHHAAVRQGIKNVFEVVARLAYAELEEK